MTLVNAGEQLLSANRFHDEAEHSWTLPARWYTDPGIFALEKENILFCNWWYAGAEAAVSDPSSYLTTTIVDQDVLVIRGADGILRGFYNVCRHRAHRLVSGKGCRHRIICPYHGWTYENDGRFVIGRGVDRIAGFDRQAAGLVPIRVDTMLGLVFVNLDAEARPLEQMAKGMLADMRAHCPNLDTLVLAHHYERETAANWKTLVDNDLESYHSATGHAALMDLLDYESFKVWEYEFATCHSMANTNPDNSAYEIAEGAAVKTAIYTWLWPNTAFFIAPGKSNLAVFQMAPTGPETSLQVWDFYFEDQNLDESEQAYVDYTIETLIPEDSALYENVQRGLRSRGYGEGRFVINYDRPEWSEHHVHLFQKLVRDAVTSGRHV